MLNDDTNQVTILGDLISRRVEANFHARLDHLKQLLKNIHPMTLASFCLPAKRKIFAATTPKKTRRMTAYWTTRGLPTRGLDNSRMPPATLRA